MLFPKFGGSWFMMAFSKNLRIGGVLELKNSSKCDGICPRFVEAFKSFENVPRKSIV